MSREGAHKECGSVTVLTLLAVGLLIGTFLYVALIGSRVSETTRARVAADATAMAAATVKAKVINYESYVLLADTVLLPLGHLTATIGEAQAAASVGCLLVSFLVPGAFKYCIFKYGKHVVKTQRNRSDVDGKVTDWLDGLEALAEQLSRVGPHWAEFAAYRAGTADSYSGPGDRGVTAAASFPMPDLDGECSKLGIEMAKNNEETRDGDKKRDACHDLAVPLEWTYLLMSFDPLAAAIDEAGLIITGNSLVWNLFGGPADCAKTNKAPKLADNWQEYSVSRGLTLVEASRDKKFLGWMDAFRRKKAVSLVQPGYLLGMSCAEHYAQDHYGGDESLWHMDWRARLVPCLFAEARSVRDIEQCGVSASPDALYIGVLQVGKMQAQFERQRLAGAAKYWTY